MNTPHWVPLGGLLIALGFLPTLAAPFDFADDGNLVYPAPAGTHHVARWWDRVAANVEHLGPFRPAAWAHWELAANAVGADPVAWRTLRLVWCGLAATAFLWLLAELGVPPPAALLATAAGMWNPCRAEVWVSLTLAEGVAMPHAVAALACARRASRSGGWWDVAAVAGLLVALGCKNTFAALVPAMLVLRQPGWRVAAVYLLPLALPAGHLLYFQTHWHPGQYELTGPTWAQAGRFAGWLRGAAGADHLGAGAVLGAFAVWRSGCFKSPPVATGGLDRSRLMYTALALLAAGTAVYLPLDIMAARYTLPAVWGADLLLALLLAKLLALPDMLPRRAAVIALAAGLAALTVANVGRQEKAAARSRLLWQALHHVERTAPPGARIEWAADGLGVEEGIHFAWHLRHRSRPDLVVGLTDAAGTPVARAELPPLDRAADLRVTAGPPAAGWRPGDTFSTRYRLGRRGYECRVDERSSPSGPTVIFDPSATAYLLAALRGEPR
jgi:hypothetical protein